MSRFWRGSFRRRGYSPSTRMIPGGTMSIILVKVLQFFVTVVRDRGPQVKMMILRIAHGHDGFLWVGAEFRRGSFRKRGRSPSTRMTPTGARFSWRSRFRRELRRGGRPLSSENLIPGTGRSHGDFSSRHRGSGRFVYLQGLDGEICFFGRSLGSFFLAFSDCFLL